MLTWLKSVVSCHTLSYVLMAEVKYLSAYFQLLLFVMLILALLSLCILLPYLKQITSRRTKKWSRSWLKTSKKSSSLSASVFSHTHRSLFLAFTLARDQLSGASSTCHAGFLWGQHSWQKCYTLVFTACTHLFSFCLFWFFFSLKLSFESVLSFQFVFCIIFLVLVSA